MPKLPPWSITNLVRLWFWRRGGEDPLWGTTHIGQLAIALTIYDLATRITDQAVSQQIQTVAGQAIARAAEKIPQ